MPTLLASNVVFTDTDTNVGKIGGTVTWDAASDETGITHYDVYYMETDGTKLSLIQSVEKTATRSVSIAGNTAIPTDATHIGVFSKNNLVLSASAATVAILDNTTGELPTVLATNVVFTDGDNNEDQISGKVTWTLAADESKVDTYALYFILKNDVRNAFIVEVAKGTSEFTIPNDTPIPSNVDRIGVYSKKIAMA